MGRLHPLVAQFVEARQARGLSQRKVARLAGLGQKTMQRMEAGTRDPHLPTLDVLADFYGAKVALVWPDRQCSMCGAAPRELTAISNRMTNSRRTAARNARLKVYASYRGTGITPAQAARQLAREFGMTERAAQRYEPLYQAQRQQEAAA